MAFLVTKRLPWFARDRVQGCGDHWHHAERFCQGDVMPGNAGSFTHPCDTNMAMGI